MERRKEGGRKWQGGVESGRRWGMAEIGRSVADLQYHTKWNLNVEMGVNWWKIEAKVIRILADVHQNPPCSSLWPSLAHHGGTSFRWVWDMLDTENEDGNTRTSVKVNMDGQSPRRDSHPETLGSARQAVRVGRWQTGEPCNQQCVGLRRKWWKFEQTFWLP